MPLKVYTFGLVRVPQAWVLPAPGPPLGPLAYVRVPETPKVPPAESCSAFCGEAKLP